MRLCLFALLCVVTLSACNAPVVQSPTPPSRTESSALPTPRTVTPTPMMQVTPTPTPTPRATPTPTPTPRATPTPTPTQVASYPADLPTKDPVDAAIIQGWQAYWRVYEKYAADPIGLTDLQETQYVTTEDEAGEILDSIAQLRELGMRSEGGLVFRAVTVTVDSGDPRRATIEYCADPAGLRVFEIKTGKRVQRSGTLLETVRMVLMPDGSWRVGQVRNELAPC